MINKDISVAFSGHRKLLSKESLFSTGIEEEKYKKSISSKLQEILAKLYSDGYRNFLCGMAIGFDLKAAEEVLKLQEKHPEIRLIAAIPYPNQAEKFSKNDKILYDNLLQKANNCISVCDAYRLDCFHRRNDFLVDNSSVLVCFYDGTKGGTAYTVKKAIKKGLKVINVKDI